MADGDSQRVRRIGRELEIHAQELFDHVRDLGFLRPADSHHRELDGACRIFMDTERRGNCGERGAASLSQLECAVGVFRKENALDGDLLRAVQLDEFGDLGVNDPQAIGEWSTRSGDAALRDDGEGATSTVDDAKSRTQGTRIEPEDSRGTCG